MKMVRCLTHAAVVLACCGLMMPRAAFAAGPAAKTSPDVALSANGSLTGVLVNSKGQPLDGAIVSVRQSGKEIARVVSTENGTFNVAGLTSGVYEVAVGQQVIPVRAWSAHVAPPAAQSQAVIVTGTATRGQSMGGLDIITLWTLTASTGALILTAINQSDLNDVEDKLDKLVSP